jgi:hypothetical protein
LALLYFAPATMTWSTSKIAASICGVTALGSSLPLYLIRSLIVWQLRQFL